MPIAHRSGCFPCKCRQSRNTLVAFQGQGVPKFRNHSRKKIFTCAAYPAHLISVKEKKAIHSKDFSSDLMGQEARY